jgi:hypothetical protein
MTLISLIAFLAGLALAIAAIYLTHTPTLCSHDCDQGRKCNCERIES